MQCFAIRAQQQHAALAERDQHGLQVELGTQPLAPLDERNIVVADTDDRFQLGPVRGQECGAAVARKIQSLGVHEHGFAGLQRQCDETLRVGQRPFGIVRKHQDIANIERLAHQRRQRIVAQRRQGCLEVQPDQLLMLAQDPQLGDGGHIPASVQSGANALRIEPCGQHIGSFIVARHTRQGHMAAQRGQVQRHVRGTARTVFHMRDVHHRHRGLGRDPTGCTAPIAVEHQVAGHQDTCA